jgi:DNA gyrase subunit A
VRVVIELKRDAMADVVLNQLYRFTPLQIELRRQHAGARRRPARGDEPEGPAHRGLRRFREEVITRRTKFELAKARDRAHILVGLAIAVANIDEVIRLIRARARSEPARRAPP